MRLVIFAIIYGFALSEETLHPGLPSTQLRGLAPALPGGFQSSCAVAPDHHGRARGDQQQGGHEAVAFFNKHPHHQPCDDVNVGQCVVNAAPDAHAPAGSGIIRFRPLDGGIQILLDVAGVVGLHVVFRFLATVHRDVGGALIFGADVGAGAEADAEPAVAADADAAEAKTEPAAAAFDLLIGVLRREGEVVVAVGQRHFGGAVEHVIGHGLARRRRVAGEADAVAIGLDLLVGVTDAVAQRLVRRDRRAGR